MAPLLEYFKKIDYFGIQPSFFYRSKAKIQTVPGALFSLTILVYTFFLTVYFFLKVYQRKNPIIASFNDFSKNQEKILNSSNFLLGFILEGADGKLFDIFENPYDLFNYYIEYEIRGYNEHDEMVSSLNNTVSNKRKKEKNHPVHPSSTNRFAYEVDDDYDYDSGFNEGDGDQEFDPDEGEDTNTPEYDSNGIKLIRCKEEFIRGFKDLSNKAHSEILKKGICFELNNSVLEGSPIFYYKYKGLKFTLRYNIYIMNNNFHIISKSFPLKMKLFYQSYSYEISNYNDPFTKELGFSELNLDMDTQLICHYTFVSTISKRDDGYFFTSVNETNINGFNQLLQSQVLSYNTDNSSRYSTLLTMRVNFHPYDLIYTRSYLKIPEVLSQIVSFSNVGIVFASFVMHLLCRGEILSALSKVHYAETTMPRRHFSSIQKGPMGLGDSITTPINTTNPECNIDKKGPFKNNFINGSKNNSPQTVPSSQNVIPIIQKPSAKKRPSKFLSFSWAKLKKKIFKRKKYDENRVIIKSYLEIENFLKNYDELKRLQIVFFNTKQLYLFKYLGTCFNSSLVEKHLLFTEGDVSCSKYFGNKITQGDLTETEQRMIDLMNEKQKEYFFGKQ